MINMDEWLLEFMRLNMVTVSLIGGAISVIAKRLKWSWLEDMLNYFGANMPKKLPIKNIKKKT